MEIVHIHDVKARLSKLIARAEDGEEIIIARAGKPVAALGPLQSERRAQGRRTMEGQSSHCRRLR